MTETLKGFTLRAHITAKEWATETKRLHSEPKLAITGLNVITDIIPLETVANQFEALRHMAGYSTEYQVMSILNPDGLMICYYDAKGSRGGA